MCTTSKELLAVVVQDRHQPLVDNDAYVVSSDVSLAGYICTHVCLIYVFAERLQSH